MKRLLLLLALALLATPATAQRRTGFPTTSPGPRWEVAGAQQNGVGAVNFSTGMSVSLSAGKLTVSILGGIPVPATRTVATTAPLGGGGTLASDLTLTCATCVTAVTASGVLSSSGGTTPNLTLTGVIPIANGGTAAATASANRVFAGPTSGGAAAPGFRALVAADIPSAAGDVTGDYSAVVVGKLQGRTVTSTAPSDGHVLGWNAGSSQWEPGVRLRGYGTAPTCTVGVGAGTGATCAVAGNRYAFLLTVTTGTGPLLNSRFVQLTWAVAFPAVPILMTVPADYNSKSTRSVSVHSELDAVDPATTTDIFLFSDGDTPTASVVYRFNCIVTER